MATHTKPQTNEPVRLLYVDSDSEAAAAMVTAFEEYGIAVTTATRTSEALERVETDPFDCLVSDAQCENDGVELLEDVRARHPALPVLLLARAASGALVDRAGSAGVTDVLRKESAMRGEWLAARIATAVAERDADVANGIPDEGRLEGGSCLLDERLRVVAASESFADLFSREPDSLAGERWTTLFPTDGDVQAVEPMADGTRPQEPSLDETIGVRSDGRTIPVRRAIARLESDTYLCSVEDRTGTSRRGVPIERYVRQRRALEALSLEVSEGPTADSFFESATAAVAEALDGDYCALFESRPEDAFVLRSGVGRDGTIERPLARSTRTALTDVLRSSEPVQFADPRSTDKGERVGDHGVELAVRAFDRPWGVLGVYAVGPRDYSPAEIAFLKRVSALLGAVIERERASAAWKTLQELATGLRESDSPEAVCDRAVDAVGSIADRSAGAIYLYDEREDALHLTGRTGPQDDGDEPAATLKDGPAWRAFVDRERTLVAECSSRPTIPVPEPSLARGAVFSLGQYGVLVAALGEAGRSASTVLEWIEAVASLARAALLRLDHERQLRERKDTIETQAETIERATAATDLTRRIDEAIISAASRDELESAVCDRLVEWEPAAFVWIGAYDEIGETIEPQAWAGAERSYLNSVSIDMRRPVEDQEPTAAAVRTSEPQVRDRLLASESPERWRREATDRGYRSVLSVPVSYGSVRYGGLTVYGDRPAAFTAEERRTVVDVGDRLGHAVHALEIKRTLLESTGVVELQFRVREAGAPFVRWAAEADARFELESVFARADDAIRGLFTIDGLDVDRVLELAHRASAVTDTRFVTERGEKRLFTCQFTADSTVSRLLEYGAVPRTMVLESDGGTLAVELPDDSDVRQFVAAFSAIDPDAELVRRHHEDRCPRTRFEFLAEVEERLTARQYEVLRMAYASGYYETPRESSGKEVAALLGIAQPTFNHHLHAAQRKLLGILFADE